MLHDADVGEADDDERHQVLQHDEQETVRGAAVDASDARERRHAQRLGRSLVVAFHRRHRDHAEDDGRRTAGCIQSIHAVAGPKFAEFAPDGVGSRPVSARRQAVGVAILHQTTADGRPDAMPTSQTASMTTAAVCADSRRRSGWRTAT